MGTPSFIKEDALKLLKHPDLKNLKVFLDCDEYFATIGMSIERKLKKPVQEEEKKLYLAYYFKYNETHYYKFVIQLSEGSSDKGFLYTVGFQRTDGGILKDDEKFLIR